MKLMIASDIHGSAVWAEQVLERFEAEKANYLILAGDLLYHGPRNPLPEGYDPQEVIRIFNNIKHRIIAVRGNCDSEVDQMVLEFPMMADYNVLPYGDHKIMISHGHLYDDRNLPKSLVAGDIFIFGHIHLPVIKQENGVYIFNPGSASMPKENHPNTYGILEGDHIQIKTFDDKTYLETTM